MTATPRRSGSRPAWPLALALLIGACSSTPAAAPDAAAPDRGAGTDAVGDAPRTDAGPATPVTPAFSAKTAFVQLEASWRYEASDKDLGAAWRAASFDDSAWTSGEAVLGYGASYIHTALPSSARTAYLRHTFKVQGDPSTVTKLALQAAYTHGFVAYLNGKEVARRSMPAGAVTHTTAALQHQASDFEEVDLGAAGPAQLVKGDNVLAVEVHNTWPLSSLMVWDGSLRFETSVEHVTRGPYLQLGTPTSVVVRWRTSVATIGRVAYGNAPDKLTQRVDEAAKTTEHEVTISGLSPGSSTYYAVGSATRLLAGGDKEHVYRAPPKAGASGQKTRIWVLGDSGTADRGARAVRDAYHKHTGATPTDLWIILGDVDQGQGTEPGYQFGLFEHAFEATLRRAVLWPIPGNHDLVPHGEFKDFMTKAPYFKIFTLPAAGEAGGAASGTEAYYSYDHANIHFVALLGEDPPPAILTWLQADLAATKQQWLIAYIHNPPYSRGSHDSDTGAGEARARAFAAVLEGYGVDLVLSGHSHVYERSILLDGHSGTSAEFLADPTKFTVDGGDGRVGGDGAYVKPKGLVPHKGTVYVESGCSGNAFQAATVDHPVMVKFGSDHGLRTTGSLILEVQGDRLDASFLDAAGAVRDSFTILKQ